MQRTCACTNMPNPSTSPQSLIYDAALAVNAYISDSLCFNSMLASVPLTLRQGHLSVAYRVQAKQLIFRVPHKVKHQAVWELMTWLNRNGSFIAIYWAEKPRINWTMTQSVASNHCTGLWGLYCGSQQQFCWCLRSTKCWFSARFPVKKYCPKPLLLCLCLISCGGSTS